MPQARVLPSGQRSVEPAGRQCRAWLVLRVALTRGEGPLERRHVLVLGRQRAIEHGPPVLELTLLAVPLQLLAIVFVLQRPGAECVGGFSEACAQVVAALRELLLRDGDLVVVSHAAEVLSLGLDLGHFFLRVNGVVVRHLGVDVPRVR